MGSETDPENGCGQVIDAGGSSMSRLQVGSTSIRQDVLRGARVSNVLGRLGALWRTSPIDVPLEARAKLWYKSKTCERLDAFLSQSWSAPGWQKHIALLLHFYWVPAAISCLVALLVLSLLDGLDCLPTVQVDETWICSKFCPWGFVPIATALVTLFLAPSMPCLRDPVVFFDAVCINQVDEKLMTEGIYSLAGFVASSKELIVLWSTSYLKRAWCVLELAVFTALNKGQAICFRPLFVTTTLFMGYIVSTASFHFVLIADLLGALSGYAVLSKVLRILICLPMPIFARNLRLHFLAMRELTSQLAHFRLDDAQCRLDRDVTFIRQNIEAFYGSRHSFEQFVRENLRSQLLASQHHFEFKYAHFLVMTFPASLNSLPQVISLVKTGAPPIHILSVIAMFVALILLFAPSMVKLFFVLCDLWSKQYDNRAINCGVDIGVTLLFFLVAMCGAMLNVLLLRSFELGGLFSVGLGSVAASVAFGARYFKFCCPRCVNA